MNTHDIDLSARRTAQLLRKELNTTFVGRFDSDALFIFHYKRHAYRIPHTEDFSQAILVELQFENLIGTEVEEKELVRVLDRIRKRIRDELKKQHRNQSLNATFDFIEIEQEDFKSDLWQYLESRLEDDEILVLLRMMEGATKGEIMKELGMSKSSFYRHQANLEKLVQSYLEI